MKVQAAAWLQWLSQEIGIQCCTTLTHLRNSCNISALGSQSLSRCIMCMASQVGVFVCSLSCLPQAADMACNFADYDILIAAGGDGTINQVVNELVDQDAPKDTCLAVLPLGTANDFATSLTIRDDNLVQAMQTAVQGVQTISWDTCTQALLCGMYCAMCLGTSLLGLTSGPAA